MLEVEKYDQYRLFWIKNVYEPINFMADTREQYYDIYLYIDNRCVFDYSAGYSEVENKIQMIGNELLKYLFLFKDCNGNSCFAALWKGHLFMMTAGFTYNMNTNGINTARSIRMG